MARWYLLHGPVSPGRSPLLDARALTVITGLAAPDWASARVALAPFAGGPESIAPRGMGPSRTRPYVVQSAASCAVAAEELALRRRRPVRARRTQEPAP